MTQKAPPDPLIIPRPAPPGTRLVLWVLTLAGLASFAAALAWGDGTRAWQIYFVNFLFWTGIAQGGVVMSAVYRIANGRWGGIFPRIGEGMITFLPLSLLLYVGLIAGGTGLFPWLKDPVPGKEIWLSGPFLFGRDAIIFLVLMWLSYKFVSACIRPEMALLKERGQRPAGLWVRRSLAGWKGWEEEMRLSDGKLKRLTPLLLIVFSVCYTLLGFDLVMALDPQWASTLFGWMFFLHAFFAALVVVAILAVAATSWFDLGDVINTSQWHDMGRFVFGFCLLSGGFFWSQFLVIWYGNLPEETGYLIKRFYTFPWEGLMWVYIILAYLLPLAVFLSRRVKEVPAALLSICAVILVALFIERFIAVVPFVWPEPSIPFGITELGITAGFAGAFVLCWLSFFTVVPLVPFRPSNTNISSGGQQA